MDSKDRFIIIGKISGVHGVRGQVKIQSYTDPLQAFTKYKQLYWNYNNNWHTMPILKSSLKANGRNFIANITDCHDRDEARKYQFVDIAVLRSSLPKIDSTSEPGQYYWADLEGLDVYSVYNHNHNHNQDQPVKNLKQYLGKIDHIISTGSNDVLIVKLLSTKVPPKAPEEKLKEHLIPYIFGKYVLAVDLENRTMIVDWDPEF